jgi:hypothetical protein
VNTVIPDAGFGALAAAGGWGGHFDDWECS